MASINASTQPVADESITSMHQTRPHGHQPESVGQETTAPPPSRVSTRWVGGRRCFRPGESLIGTPYVGRPVLSDVDLVRHRRVNFNHVIRRQMELICEKKISKNKLEEAHFSIPSSVKSTLMMSFSPDGQRVASTHGDHRIYICDLNTGKFLDTLEGHPKTPWCVAWHPTNREILASGCLAGEVRVWDLKSKACESWTSGNNTIITSLDFHPKERVLVVATANDIHFWDWSESEPFAKTTTMHDREKVKYVLFDSTGTKLITGISNSPRYTGYGSDSLQNRIIDGYMLPGNLQAENMTNNSEITITSPVNRTGNNHNVGQQQQPQHHQHQQQQQQSSSNHDRHLNFSTNINHNFSNSNNINNNINNNNNNNDISNHNSNANHNNSNNNNINNINNSTNEHDVHYRNTMTLSRVAFLYRQLEALEDSMRNTSFTPYMSPRPIETTNQPIDFNQANSDMSQGECNSSNDQSSGQRESKQSGDEANEASIVNNDLKSNEINDRVSSNDQTDASNDQSSQPSQRRPPTAYSNDKVESEKRDTAKETIDDTATTTSTSTPAPASSHTATPLARTSNTFEPYLVAFDESLEQLQLPPLVVDGQTVNLATIIERYPLDISHQLHYVMQSESINQVNQNFIRISKLMSSARLYRQIVQQIQQSANNNNNNSSSANHQHHQANQILTAQSVSPRSSRNSANLPIVLRNFSISDLMEPSGLLRANRSTDPVMGVQFRNTARNVPLVTICKMDLIAARALCIIRSQQLVDQALVSSDSPSSSSSSSVKQQQQQQNRKSSSPAATQSSKSSSNQTAGRDADDIRQDSEDDPSRSFNYCSLLTQLHSSLTTINHAPLTTSNVYSHITSLRVLIDKIWKIMSRLLNDGQPDGRRLQDLIHNTAFNLTGRRWSVPLGPTYDELRLDVIHTICIVDLTLHFVRQVQLLQMQRISFMARIDEYRRVSSSSSGSSSLTHQPSAAFNDGHTRTPNEIIQHAGSSSSSSLDQDDIDEDNNNNNLAGPSNCSNLARSIKRKNDTEQVGEKTEVKRRRVDEDRGDDTEMTVAGTTSSISTLTEANNHHHNHLLTPGPQHLGGPADAMTPADRLLIWSNPQNTIEQTLQRLLMATASNNTNSHILVRIYHRLHGASSLPPIQAAASLIDHSIEQQLPPLSHLPPYESSRRRALSQDNNNSPITANNNNNNNNNTTTESSQQSSLPYLLQSSLSSSSSSSSSSSVESSFANHSNQHHHIPNNSSSSSSSPMAAGSRTGRLRPPTALQMNFVPSAAGPGGSVGGPPGAGAAAHSFNGVPPAALPFDAWQRHHPHLHVYQTRGSGQHLWFNQWTIPFPVNNSNFRLQCWNFSLNAIPNIKDPQSNVITHRCRIHNDSSVDLSSDGVIVACLVPRDDVLTCMPSFDLKIFSLRSSDFGACYYKLPQGPNAVSVSLSPSGNYAVVGLASHKFISNDPNDDDLTIAKVFRLDSKKTYGFVRDIKIKRGDSSLSLNAIKWMPRGIVYNVGPQHHQRYQAARMRNVVAS